MCMPFTPYKKPFGGKVEVWADFGYKSVSYTHLVHAKAHATVDEGGLQLNLIAVAPVVLGMADGLSLIHI